MAPTQNAKCARTACDNPHDNMRHVQSRLLYCRVCARKINVANKADAIALGVHPLIRPVETPDSTSAPAETA